MSAADALAYVDKTLDNVADVGPDVMWKNGEVVALLEDVRALILTGEPLPGLFPAVDPEHHAERYSPDVLAEVEIRRQP